MPTVVVRHKVGDYDRWLKGHQERKELFGSAGANFKTFRDTDDPNSIVLVMEVTDMEKFEALFKDPVTAKKKEEHTVIDPIIVSMPVDV